MTETAGASASDTPRSRRIDDPLWNFMGGHFESAGEGRASTTLPVGPAVLNPNGRTHGSILFALLDFTMGAALMTVDRAMARTATVQMDLHFIRSARHGTLRCEAWVVRRGRQISVAEGEIRDDAGELLCRATGTFTSPGG